MNKLWTVLAGGAVLAVVSIGPAAADTCSTHYTLCVEKYGNAPKVCACAKALCVKKVGSGDAGPKWNWIPGVNACFGK